MGGPRGGASEAGRRLSRHRRGAQGGGRGRRRTPTRARPGVPKLIHEGKICPGPSCFRTFHKRRTGIISAAGRLILLWCHQGDRYGEKAEMGRRGGGFG